MSGKSLSVLLSVLFLVLAGCGQVAGEGDGEDEEEEGTALVSHAPDPGDYQVVAFNDLGMHCMDGDYSVFAILPPFNVVNAQVVATGTDGGGTRLVDDAEVSLRYRARTDPQGSVNSTSAGKTNFWDFEKDLFGVELTPGTGLTGQPMPGQGAEGFGHFDPAKQWFRAEGIPITPTDDAGGTNHYPVLTVEAVKNGQVVASTPVVLPVSTEMDCMACHDTGGAAADAAGINWSGAGDKQIRTRENILLLHDDSHGTDLANSTPVLCADCHYSPALDLAGTGPDAAQQGQPALSHAVHGFHADRTYFTNNAGDMGKTCYQCHPGSKTQCLRGAMGDAGIDCQGCHGGMSAVADPSRDPWLDLPACGSCHTGTATDNQGQIRFDTALLAGGQARQPARRRFAEPAGALFRNSTGHGDLACEACHGGTHAIFPSSAANDGLRPTALQGHNGTVTECRACHADGPPRPWLGGPHGLHPVNDGGFVGEAHGDLYEADPAACRACHGPDLTGTVLSRAAAERRFATEEGTHAFSAGEQVGCGSCHRNPANGGVEGDYDD